MCMCVCVRNSHSGEYSDDRLLGCLIEVYRCLKDACCFHHQDYMAQHPTNLLTPILIYPLLVAMVNAVRGQARYTEDEFTKR